MTRSVVLAIVGLTGTGKTDLAAEVARRTGAEIVSADSMQVYRGMDVGTAKPPRALRDEIPHHMIDVVAPDDAMSAGRWAAGARAVTHEIDRRGRRVIVCGGTGLYARAFAGGLAPDLASSSELRRALRARPLEDLVAELERRDPASAARIAPRDRVRIERALEAQELSGQPTSRVRAEHRFADRPFRVRWLVLDAERSWLWARIAERVDAMLRAGWVEEVRTLRDTYGAAIRPLQAIGYRELGAVLDGELSLAEARERIVVATRRYAKRQRTWFRAESGAHWVEAGSPAPLERALELLES